jgi:hypothetical protein
MYPNARSRLPDGGGDVSDQRWGRASAREGVVMNTSIETALKMLDEQGHRTISCSYRGQDWFHLLDCHVLLKPQEMEELGDGVYSFDELMELLCQRRLEEQGLL